MFMLLRDVPEPITMRIICAFVVANHYSILTHFQDTSQPFNN